MGLVMSLRAFWPEVCRCGRRRFEPASLHSLLYIFLDLQSPREPEQMCASPGLHRQAYALSLSKLSAFASQAVREENWMAQKAALICKEIGRQEILLRLPALTLHCNFPRSPHPVSPSGTGTSAAPSVGVLGVNRPVVF